VTGRQKSYLLLRGSGAFLFIFASTVLPRGVPAAIVAMTGGVIALLTCIGVNAGGPGEQAGAHLEHMNLEKVRPPQGDWPPYTDDMVVEGEVLNSSVRSPEKPAG
jgi:hypothetical protein